MQSFRLFMYLYSVNIIRHLLLLALFCSVTTVLADGTYAVIISGGRNKMYNHERYWNDCAFLYRTLRQTFHLSKDHITLLMADGNSPAADMLLDGGTSFVSSHTDLDGDGVPDLTQAATRQNLSDTFHRLSGCLTANDHLFIYITDHGERTSADDVHLWLWGNDLLRPEELADLINLCHPATMNIILGQCHAGAFVQSLQAEGRVITAACSADQMSWSCKDRPYDEFVYHWTCAVAQHDEFDRPVSSDQNGDGYVTMDEAYNYACRHDRRPETPSISSQPVILAAQWFFSNVETKTDVQSISNQDLQRSNIYDLQGRKRN